jgi:hypothetical protein
MESMGDAAAISTRSFARHGSDDGLTEIHGIKDVSGHKTRAVLDRFNAEARSISFR